MSRGKPTNWVFFIFVAVVIYLLLNPWPIILLLHIVYTLALTALIVIAAVFLLKRM